MKKMVLLSVFVIVSMMLLSTMSFPVFAHEPRGPMDFSIEFSGKIAISQVDIIQWRIVVDGMVKIDGVVHDGKYTVVKMLPSNEFPEGEILHGPVTVFNWKMKRCQLKMIVKELFINLNVLWKAKSLTFGGSDGTLSFGGDTFDFEGEYQYREADVSGVQKTIRRGIIHRTGLGYIAEGTGTINPASAG